MSYMNFCINFGLSSDFNILPNVHVIETIKSFYFASKK